MKLVSLLFIAGSVALAGLSFSFINSKEPKRMINSPGGNGFAVVELFTSEGCSSCPPADEVLIRLAKEFPEHVYFLGYHVDYWDYLGWKDAFSSPDYTERQQQYSNVFGANSIYTPQAIVNGEKELVGSRESELKRIIQQQLKNTASSSIEIAAKKGAGENIGVSYKVTNTGKASLDIALVQLMATSNVKRGENEGHTLKHINIVRALKTISIIKDTNGTIDFKIPKGLSVQDLKVIAFVQDERTLKINGASESLIN